MAGSLDFFIPYVLMLAYTGACLADILSFMIGRYFQGKLDNIWPFLQHPEWLKEGREFIDLYGVAGIFIGRFIGPVRSLLPLVAGSLGMQIKKFVLIDLISGSSLNFSTASSLPVLIISSVSWVSLGLSN